MIAKCQLDATKHCAPKFSMLSEQENRRIEAVERVVKSLLPCGIGQFGQDAYVRLVGGLAHWIESGNCKHWLELSIVVFNTDGRRVLTVDGEFVHSVSVNSPSSVYEAPQDALDDSAELFAHVKSVAFDGTIPGRAAVVDIRFPRQKDESAPVAELVFLYASSSEIQNPLSECVPMVWQDIATIDKANPGVAGLLARSSSLLRRSQRLNRGAESGANLSELSPVADK